MDDLERIKQLIEEGEKILVRYLTDKDILAPPIQTRIKEVSWTRDCTNFFEINLGNSMYVAIFEELDTNLRPEPDTSRIQFKIDILQKIYNEIDPSKNPKSTSQESSQIEETKKQVPIEYDEELIYLLLLKYEGREEVDLSKYDKWEINRHEAHLIRKHYLIGEIWNTSAGVQTEVSDLRVKGAIKLEEIREDKRIITIELPSIQYSYEDGESIPFQEEKQNINDSDPQNINIDKLTELIAKILHDYTDFVSLCMKLNIRETDFPEIRGMSTNVQKLVLIMQSRNQTHILFDTVLTMRPEWEDEFRACLK